MLTPAGWFVLGDLVVPRPKDRVTPVAREYDVPSSTDEQLAWLRHAGLQACVWDHLDLAVLAGERVS